MWRSVFFVTAILFLSKAQATTIHVPTERPTIQAGIDAAFYGDTILVAAGTYYENVVCNKSLSIIGESSHNTIIDAGGIKKCIFVNSFGAISGIISGFTLTNAGIDGSDNVTNFAVVILTNGRGHWTISENLFKDNPEGGLIVFGPVSISRNVFVDNRTALMVSSDANAVVHNNSLLRSEGIAILVHLDAINMVAHNNIVVDNGYGMYNMGIPAYQIYNNLVWGNMRDYYDFPVGTDDISTDPLFCDANNGDYRLWAVSPCSPHNSPNGELIGALDAGCYNCGDTDASGGELTIEDVQLLYEFYFWHSSIQPYPSGAGDLDCDGFITIADVVLLAGYVGGFGPAPCCALSPKLRSSEHDFNSGPDY